MKKYLQLTTSLFLLFSLLLIMPNETIANHIVAMDIEWECIDKYKIITTVYRDCNGSTLDAPILTLSGNGCDSTVTTTFSGLPKDITPVCKGRCTRCDSNSCGFPFGIQAIVSTVTVDFTSWKNRNCCEVKISYATCCRSAMIETGAANENFYTEAMMNICQTPCDNSPKFLNTPYQNLCVGSDNIINPGTINTDRDAQTGKLDSLVFSLTNPLVSATKPTTWSTPYSTLKPIYYLGFPKENLDYPRGFNLESESGDLSFKPMKTETTIVSLKVETYRNGVKIAENRRELLFQVIKCGYNETPVISGKNYSMLNPDAFKSYAVVGEKLCFTICSSDKNIGDTVKLKWNEGIPKASFAILNKGDKREKAEFCWTPDSVHVSRFPHTFVVTAEDNSCMDSKFSSRGFAIFVSYEPVSIPNLEEMGIAIFPNPASNYIAITDNNEITKAYRLKSIDGKTISTGILSNSNQQINTTNLNNGIYLLELQTKDQQVFHTKIQIIK